MLIYEHRNKVGRIFIKILTVVISGLRDYR